MIFDEMTAPIAQPGVAPEASAKPIAKWSEVQLYWEAWIERSKPKLQQAATAAQQHDQCPCMQRLTSCLASWPVYAALDIMSGLDSRTCMASCPMDASHALIEDILFSNQCPCHLTHDLRELTVSL